MKKEENIQVVVLDQENGIAKKETIKNSLDSFYKAIHCNMIDIAERKINGHVYDVITDDGGLLRPFLTPSVVDKKGRILLCGSVIICNCDEETGEESSLTDKQVQEILSQTRNVLFAYKKEPVPIVWTDEDIKSLSLGVEA